MIETQASTEPAAGWLNRNVFGIGLASFFGDANYEMVLSILPLFLTVGLGAPAAAVGLVEGLADGSAAAVKLGSGWYSDRTPQRRRLATAGYVLTTIGMAALTVVTSWPQAALARAAAWVGRGTRTPIRDALLAGSVSAADRGKAFGFHHALDTSGALIGPLIALLLVASIGFRGVLAVAIVPGILSVLAFAFLTKDPKVASPGPLAGRDALPARFLRFLLPVGLFGLVNFAPVFFTLRVKEILTPELGATTAVTVAIAFYAGYNLVGAVVSFPAGWLGDRFSSMTVLGFGYLLFAAACFSAVVAVGFIGIGLLALLAGSHAAVVDASEGATASHLLPGSVAGTGFGLMAAVNGVGDLVSSVSVGLVWTAVGPMPALFVCAGVSLIAWLLLLAVSVSSPFTGGPKGSVAD